MRPVFSISLAFLLLFPTIAKGIVLADYALHRDFIRQELCLQKNEPINLCSGTCYLSQRVKVIDGGEEHKQLPRSLQEKPELNFPAFWPVQPLLSTQHTPLTATPFPPFLAMHTTIPPDPPSPPPKEV